MPDIPPISRPLLNLRPQPLSSLRQLLNQGLESPQLAPKAPDLLKDLCPAPRLRRRPGERKGSQCGPVVARRIGVRTVLGLAL